MKSRATLSASAAGKKTKITFSNWMAKFKDRYDFDYSEHFTVVNPDFGSKIPDAVRPEDQSITVYHKNAQRLEEAGLAAPYDLESKEWPVYDQRVTASAEIDPNKKY